MLLGRSNSPTFALRWFTSNLVHSRAGVSTTGRRHASCAVSRRHSSTHDTRSLQCRQARHPRRPRTPTPPASTRGSPIGTTPSNAPRDDAGTSCVPCTWRAFNRLRRSAHGRIDLHLGAARAWRRQAYVNACRATCATRHTRVILSDSFPSNDITITKGSRGGRVTAGVDMLVYTASIAINSSSSMAKVAGLHVVRLFTNNIPTRCRTEPGPC